MHGLMQAQPLTTAMLIRHAATNHPRREIVSRRADGSLERSDWQTVERHARHIAAGLADLGLKPGDRVATLAWNRLPHLELYYGVSGADMVLHTVNPRLFPEQIRYIIDHGGARVLCVDPDLLPMIEPLLSDLPKIERVIILADQADMPETAIADPISYQSLTDGPRAIANWPDLDENSASALCYTSGTTGNPKGVLYSHRSTVLHAMSALANDSMSLGAADSILVVTPLFHVNAWGIPYSAAMAGSKLVLPGSALDPVSLYELMRDEGVTFSLGVPTIWFAFLDHLERERAVDDRKALRLDRIFTGGAATPRSLIERFRNLLGVETMQAWGMTETSPVATVCKRPLAHHADLRRGGADRPSRDAGPLRVRRRTAHIEDEDGKELPRDGEAAGCSRFAARGC
jgi:acyl-CoA synthetase (AMP-forming)/AMP-acid ligase II